MGNKIEISYNKTLKLTNALVVSADVDDFAAFGNIVEKMDNYIRSKGALPIGPIIHNTTYIVDDEGQPGIKTYFIRQSNNFIHNVDSPYKMESVIRVSNCMYAHYVGPEEKTKLAYDKIDIVAFEENIELSNEVYAILVGQHDDENVITDVFVQKSDT